MPSGKERASLKQEEITKARQMDLLTYLRRYEPDELVHFSGNTYCTRTHDSLKISNGKWYWWSRGIGGRSALDYLTKVKGVELRQAVEILAGAPRPSVHEKIAEQKEEAIKLIQLPPRHADNRRVFAYLSGSRGIDPEIINHCIKAGQLYEDAKHHNCVFLGFDGKTPKYAMLRGTLTSSAFVGEAPGSDKRFGFIVPRQGQERGTVCVFESAIDALSYLTLIKGEGKDWRQASTLSLGGIHVGEKEKMTKFPVALEHYLKANDQIKKIILCLDNDGPGRAAAQEIRHQLEERYERRYEVVDNPPRDGKDYNELLQKIKGLRGKVKTRGQPGKGMER